MDRARGGSACVVQIGESSIAPPSAPAPVASSNANGVGTLEVTVRHSSVCWDSTSDGQPAAHAGATVTVGTRSETTDADGRARFVAVPAGSTPVHASAQGYAGASTNVSVTSGGTTSAALQISLSQQGGIVTCQRQHTARPSNPPTVTSLPDIFWHDEFLIVIREIGWIGFIVLTMVFGIFGMLEVGADLGWHPIYAGLSLPAACLAAAAYLTMIIFGEIPGYPTIIVACLGWIALVVLTFCVAFGLLPRPHLDLFWFPPLCGMWVCFFAVLAIGRITYEIMDGWWYALLFPIIAVAAGVGVLVAMLVLAAPTIWANGSEVVGFMIFTVVFSYAFGILSGLAGHVFVNEGNLESFNPRQEKVSLPYAGERYCVQGNRGWFSHYASNAQVFCYDFAVPAGTHVLAIEEGHVIHIEENHVGSYYDGSNNQDANQVQVQHRDGTIAHYLHLQTNGVSAINPVLVANSHSTTPGRYSSDVHVHAGQILALAGSTGISRFPHIHLMLYRAGTQIGILFKDASVQRHGGRCYTFRKYLSENPDNGPIAV